MITKRRTIVNKPRLPQMPAYKAALTAVRNGSRNARVLCLGDSITEGNNADSAYLNAYNYAWPNQLAAKLNAAGLPAKCDAACGFTLATYNPPYQSNQDPRVVFTGSAYAPAAAAITQSIGGVMGQFPNSTGKIAITPANSVDTFKVYYAIVNNASTHSQFCYNLNGGSNTTIEAYNAVTGIGSFTISGTLGTNTLNMNWVASYANIIGWEAYNSAVKAVTLINAGWSGSTTNHWTDKTYGYSAGWGIAALAPDLTIIELGINDFNTGVSVATYTANMQTIITQAKSAGDCMLVTGVPWDPTGSGVSYATQGAYWAVMHQLAMQNNIRIVDMYTRWGTLAAGTARGVYAGGSYNASSHPSAAGQVDYASAICNMLTN